MRHIALAIPVGITVLGALPASGIAQDDCGQAAYCLPAPPATAAAKTTAASKGRKVLGVSVATPKQVGVALITTPRSSITRPRRPQTVPVVAVYCTASCRVDATFELELGGRASRPASRTVTLRKRGSGALRVALSPGAAGGELTARLTVTDAFGTHEETRRVKVRGSGKR